MTILPEKVFKRILVTRLSEKQEEHSWIIIRINLIFSPYGEFCPKYQDWHGNNNNGLRQGSASTIKPFYNASQENITYSVRRQEKNTRNVDRIYNPKKGSNNKCTL